MARGKLTAQSNVRYGGLSPRAVDGNTNGYYFRHGTCTYSEGNDVTNPWWRVDLASCYAVTRVVVYSRVDCCSNRLTDMEIRICTILFVVGLLSGLVLFGEGLRLVVTEDSTTCVEVIFRTLIECNFQTGCCNISHNQQQSVSGLQHPGRSTSHKH